MPDIRYHFVYLIAVFLMLGFGMMLGANFVGPDQIKRQTVYIRDLRAQSSQAMQEGRTSHDQLAKTDAALDAVRPALVRGKLAGRRVTLIQTGDYADATQAAATALRDAGAATVVTVVLSDRWSLLPDPAQNADIASLAATLSAGTALDAKSQALQRLEELDLVTVTGDLDSPCALFVLVGGAKDDDGSGKPGALDAALAAQLKTSSGVTIVGCEPLGAAFSFIPAYQGAQIATVDCIDRPLGQLALPFALRGEADDYGLKPTARSQVPPSLEASPSP